MPLPMGQTFSKTHSSCFVNSSVRSGARPRILGSGSLPLFSHSHCPATTLRIIPERRLSPHAWDLLDSGLSPGPPPQCRRNAVRSPGRCSKPEGPPPAQTRPIWPGAHGLALKRHLASLEEPQPPWPCGSKQLQTEGLCVLPAARRSLSLAPSTTACCRCQRGRLHPVVSGSCCSESFQK